MRRIQNRSVGPISPLAARVRHPGYNGAQRWIERRSISRLHSQRSTTVSGADGLRSSQSTACRARRGLARPARCWRDWWRCDRSSVRAQHGPGPPRGARARLRARRHGHRSSLYRRQGAPVWMPPPIKTAPFNPTCVSLLTLGPSRASLGCVATTLGRRLHVDAKAPFNGCGLGEER